MPHSPIFVHMHTQIVVTSHTSCIECSDSSTCKYANKNTDQWRSNNRNMYKRDNISIEHYIQSQKWLLSTPQLYLMLDVVTDDHVLHLVQ